MVSDEIQQLKATMDGLVREQADRRALLERQGEEIKAKSQEYMTKQVQAAERYVQHRRELGRREREAGGWSTEKTLADKDPVLGFGPESEESEPADYAAAETPVDTTERTERTPSPRRGRHSRDDEFDEDDYSNHNWLN